MNEDEDEDIKIDLFSCLRTLLFQLLIVQAFYAQCMYNFYNRSNNIHDQNNELHCVNHVHKILLLLWSDKNMTFIELQVVYILVRFWNSLFFSIHYPPT